MNNLVNITPLKYKARYHHEIHKARAWDLGLVRECFKVDIDTLMPTIAYSAKVSLSKTQSRPVDSDLSDGNKYAWNDMKKKNKKKKQVTITLSNIKHNSQYNPVHLNILYLLKFH